MFVMIRLPTRARFHLSIGAVVVLVGCGGDVEGTPSSDAATTDTSTMGDSGQPDTAVSDGRSDAPRFDACDGAAQCILAITDCCGKCGDPVITDFDAINRTQEAAHRATVCKDPTPACPDCAAWDDPNLVAFCRDSRCVGVDVRTDAISECAKDDDCMLRAGSDCCEACSVVDARQIIALGKAKGGELQAQVCDPLAGACPPCMPVYPTNVVATCDLSAKRCRVTVK